MPKDHSGTGKQKMALISALIAGIFLVLVAGFTVKATDTAAFCVSCHAMSEAVWTHKSSLHAKLDCIECHAPHSLVGKIPFKTKLGLRDLQVNAFSNIPDTIHATKNMKEVVKQNCRRCHYATTMNTSVMDVKQHCTDCHRNAPHMKLTPIDKRRAGDA